MSHRDWKTQQAIAREVLAGRGDQAFETFAVGFDERAHYQRLASDALGAAIRRRSPFRRHYRARIRNPIWVVVVLASLIGVGCLGMAAALWRHVDFADDRTYSLVGALAGFSAIGVAAIGWVAAGWITHRTGRSKLTMDVVAARYSQPAFSEALTAFVNRFGTGAVDHQLVTKLEASADDEDRRAVQGLRYLLNYCEFIAVGVLEGELDERIVAKTLRGTINTVHDRSQRYIAHLQRTNPRTLEHFSLLRDHYRDL